MAANRYVCTLSEEMLQKAKDELMENPQTRHLEIKALRERLSNVSGLKSRMDDHFLLRFLRAKKFNQEKAFSQIVTYYKMLKENPDVYQDLTPRRVSLVLDSGVTGILSDRAPDGSRVVIFRPGLWDPERFSLSDVHGNNFLTLSKLIEEEETQVCGITMVADLKGMGWIQCKHMSLNAHRVASLLQEAFPARFKGWHFVHEPTFFHAIFPVIKQFMSDKLLKRTHLHGDNLSSLQDFIPPNILPAEYGGQLPAFCPKNWVDTLLASEIQFVEDNKFGLLDMTLTSKPLNKLDATESLVGTFRKLNVY